MVQQDKDIFLRTELKNFSGITLKKAGNMLEERKRKYIQDILDIPCIYFGKQVHSNNIKVIEGKDKGNFFDNTDGLITFEKNIFLGVFVADCYPVFIEGENFVGILHCGFRSVKDGIIEKFFEIMKGRKVDINRINSFIGPGICTKHYWIDLKSIIRAKLENFSRKFVESFDICTFEDERFFSYRREKTNSRNLAIIGRC